MVPIPFLHDTFTLLSNFSHHRPLLRQLLLGLLSLFSPGAVREKETLYVWESVILGYVVKCCLDWIIWAFLVSMRYPQASLTYNKSAGLVWHCPSTISKRIILEGTTLQKDCRHCASMYDRVETCTATQWPVETQMEQGHWSSNPCPQPKQSLLVTHITVTVPWEGMY